MRGTQILFQKHVAVHAFSSTSYANVRAFSYSEVSTTCVIYHHTYVRIL